MEITGSSPNESSVDEISRERIADVIKDLIEHDKFKYSFDWCDDFDEELEDEPNDRSNEEWFTTFNAYKQIIYST